MASSNNTEDEDVTFEILNNSRKGQDTTYNVSAFLRKYERTYDATKMDKFVSLLHDKVSIDYGISKYKRIIMDIDTIADSMSRYLQEDVKEINILKRVTIGSQLASCGFKVGLPLETNIVLLVDGMEDWRIENAYKSLCLSLEKKNFVAGLNHQWHIHHHHAHSYGVVVLMECKELFNKYRESIGACINIEFVKISKRMKLTNKAETYLKHLELYDEFLYSIHVIGYNQFTPCSTQTLEMLIINEQTEDVMAAYRVVKCILQQFYKVSAAHDSGKYHPYALHERTSGIHPLSYMEMVQWYGYKPLFDTYYLRQCLLHLLIHTYDTALASRLTGGALTCCLLDIVHHFCENIGNNFYDALHQENVHIEEPEMLLESLPELTRLLQEFGEHAVIGEAALIHYPLLNSYTQGHEIDIEICFSNYICFGHISNDIYNVSAFLENYENNYSKESRCKISNFVTMLSNKISIHHDDPRYKTIISDMETIADRMFKHLLEKVDEPKVLDRIKTGSLHAQPGCVGFKVGLPLETDHLLVMDNKIKGKVYIIPLHERTIYYQTLCSLLEKENFVASLNHKWQILQYCTHDSGLVVLMECHGVNNYSIGACMDLVPATKPTPDLIERIKLTNKAEVYLEHLGLHKQIPNNIYIVLNCLVSKYSTGLLETLILDKQTEDIRVAYRVAKYLIQQWYEPLNCATDSNDEYHPYCLHECILNIHQHSHLNVVQLYGYKPLFKSYYLRQLLLHLLMNTYNTSLAPRLTGGALVCCLLDMVRHCCENQKLINALQHNRVHLLSNIINDESLHKLSNLVHDFKKHAIAGDPSLSHYPLLNSSI